MEQPIIEVKNIGKEYDITHQRGGYVSLRDVLMNVLKSPFSFLKHKVKQAAGFEKKENFWALRDVNFTVNKGEVVGIIGRNGAGKSTLLKILSQITPPTTGEIKIHGRVGSLLEVGTGFHPELTGRENIFLNGAILGMKKKEIEKKFDEIVAFSGIGKFLDTPVKHYSSGMYVRLAFSVAAHMEPDILIIDEVLAVGDAEFQKKCLGKMEEVTQKEGRTIIFVSHNLDAVRTLCKKSILLENGKILKSGKTEEVISEYLGENKNKNANYKAVPGDKPKIVSVEIETSEKNNIQINGKPFDLKIKINTPHTIKNASLSFQMINSTNKIPYVHLWTYDQINPMLRTPGTYELDCMIPKLHLYMGKYNIKIYFTETNTGEVLEILEDVCPFEVTMSGHIRDYPFINDTCAYIEDSEWKIKKN